MSWIAFLYLGKNKGNEVTDWENLDCRTDNISATLVKIKPKIRPLRRSFQNLQLRLEFDSRRPPVERMGWSHPCRAP